MVNRLAESNNASKSLSYLNVITGTACSLKCKDCGNFIPYVKPSLYNIDDIISDLKVLLNAFNSIKILQIQGGEALIHPDIVTLLEYVVKNEHIETIQLTTNGVVPVKNDLINLLKNETKILVGISEYEPYVNCKDFIDALDNNKIRYSKYRFVSKSGEWYDLGGINKLRENNDDIVMSRFNSCPFRICATLDNGIVGRCARSTVARQVFPLDNADNDYLFLRTINPIDKQKIYNYFNDMKHIEACYYCNGISGERIPPAIQL